MLRPVRLVVVTALLAAAAVTPPSALARTHVGPPQGGRILGAVPRHGHAVGPSIGALAPSAHGLWTDLPPIPGPLLNHGGPVMHTVTVHPIYWAPAGSGYPSGYQTLVDQFLGDVAAESNTTSNVWGALPQYHDGTGHVADQLQAASSFVDTNSDPNGTGIHGACTGNPGAGVPNPPTPCVADGDIRQELSNLLVAHPDWPQGSLADVYVFLLPAGVTECMAQYSICSNNTFCAYHSWTYAGSSSLPALYVVEPEYAVGDPGCDPAAAAPNGNAADVAVNTLSHELNEAETDPYGNAWFDSKGEENGDKCAWNYGSWLGADYNQIVNGHHYLLQREWSNAANGCYAFGAPTIGISGISPGAAAAGATVGITGTNFFAASGSAPSVLFNGHASPSVTVDSPTHLTVVVPDVAGVTGHVSVHALGGSATSAQVFGLQPSVTSLSVSSGVAGQTVTIGGTGFFGVTSVRFNGAAGTFNSVAADGTSLHAIVPAAATTGLVSVATAGGTGSSGTIFTVLPKITSFTPTAAVAGATVTINGTGLGGATAVDFYDGTADTIASPAVTAVSPTQVRATVPTDAVNGPLTVTVGTQTSPPSASSFRPVPSVTALSPTDGAAGTSVKLSGGNFTGAFAVKFGTVAASSFTVDSATQITAVVPGGTFSSGTVSVTTPAGTGASKVAFALTKLTSLSPLSAKAGATLTINGQGLGSTTSVDFASHAGVVPSSVTATSVHVVVPDDATAGVLTLHTPRADPTTATAFKPLPSISGSDQTNYQANDTVVISGSNFGGVTAVKLGTSLLPSGSPGWTYVSPTEIDVTLPATALTGAVTVTTPAGSSAAFSSLKVRPTLSEPFSPDHGPAGTTLTLGGQTFTGTTRVTVGGVVASYAVLSASSLRVTIPSAAVTGAIAVTNAGGTTTSAGSFTVDPKVTSFSPAAAAAGATVTINGQGLGSTTSVDFIGHAGVVPSSVTATSVHVVVPNDAASGVLTVHTPTATAATATAFNPLPSIAAPLGAVPAGATVHLSGGNLTGVSAVKIGALTLPGGDWGVVSPTQLDVIVPDNAVTGAVAVTTPARTVTSPTPLKVAPRFDTFHSTDSGHAGDALLVDGGGLTGTTSVKWTGAAGSATVAGTFSVVGPTQLRIVIPTAAATGTVAITNAGGTATTTAVTVQPHITSFAPASGATGTSVTINGNGLLGVTSVEFGGSVSATPTSTTATAVHVVVPAGAVSGQLTVHSGADSATSAGVFTVTLSVSGISPAIAPYGHSVTITGAGFSGATAVKFNGVPGTIESINGTGTAIQATTPASGAISGPVTVWKSTVSVPAPTQFTLLAIGSVSPDPVLGGQSVTLTGSGFTGATKVAFAPGGDVTSLSINPAGTQITLTAPSGFTGGSITVYANGGATVSATGVTAMTLTGVTPSGSPSFTGGTLTISGSGFTGATAVDVAGVPATYSIASDTTIHATVPAGAAGTTGAVSVTGPGGTVTGSATIRTASPVVIDEVAGDVSGGGNLVELRVLHDADLGGAQLFANGSVIATFPTPLQVTAGDLVVAHLGDPGIASETSSGSESDCVATACYAGAWDVNATGNLSFGDVVLEVKSGGSNDPVVDDAVPFTSSSVVTAPTAYTSAYAAIVAAHRWSGTAVDWSSMGTTATGTTAQRAGSGADTNAGADWSAAASTLGAAN